MERALLPPEYALLGLLLEEPRHGYDLARYFDDDLTTVCPVEQSSLYGYLRNLEVRGLVTWDEVRVGRRPPRKRYALTEDGRAAVARWLAAPVGRLREVRLDFLLKLYFLHRLDPAAERALVDAQLEVCRGYLAKIEAQVPAGDFDALVIASRRSAAEATVAWLAAHAGQLATPTPGVTR